jgi:hypothetical protein
VFEAGIGGIGKSGFGFRTVGRARRFYEPNRLWRVWEFPVGSTFSTSGAMVSGREIMSILIFIILLILMEK